jgi:serine/threonine-protein kinase RsbT
VPSPEPDPPPRGTPAVGAGAARDLPADDLLEVRTIVRRVIGSRVRDRHLVDDLVQETLTRVLSSWERIDPATLVPYAITTARNVVASTWRQVDTTERNLHRIVELLPVERPEDVVLDREASGAVAHALTRLSDRERDALLAHDVEGRDLASLARDLHTSSGALAAQLKRTRARLRVEFLLAMDQSQPPTSTCRPVLLALSGGDRRRQLELDVAGHLLGCTYCTELGAPLADRSRGDGSTRIAVTTDADVVLARQTGRALAADLGFGATDGTVIATAISEVTRNIVKFAGTGEVLVGRVDAPARCGLRVVARDAGPGIPDVEQALVDGHTTYGGLGLGLPGCRRLMDDFEITSGPGRGTTVTMAKWRSTGRTSG